MKKIIINADILYGKNLNLIKNSILVTDNTGKIIEIITEKASTTKYKKSLSKDHHENAQVIDASNYLIIPGLINSHTHIGDAIGKDISSSSDLKTRIHPKFSIKKTILEKTTEHQLEQMIRNAVISMINKGITTFVDFREGGIDGINILTRATKNIPVKKIILGRIDNEKLFDKNHQDNLDNTEKESIFQNGLEILNLCNGFGLSGANEVTDGMLNFYKKIISYYKNTHKNNCIIAIHAAESPQTVRESLDASGQSEIKRTILMLDPDVYIHVTNPIDDDLQLIKEKNKAVIICPRSNGILGCGFIPLRKMLNLNLKIAIGTDNVMLNSPDLFKEMDYLIKSQRSLEKDAYFLDPKEILKMVTVNPSEIFGLNTGCIDVGYQADVLFIDKYNIDLYPMHDIYMSIIHRCTETQIKAVLINGNFIYGDLNSNIIN